MKLISLLIFFTFSVCFGSNLDIEKDHLTAIELNKGLLVKMTASWCHPCKEFDKNIAGKDAFKSSLVNINFVHLDYTRGVKGLFEYRYANYFGSRVPTLVLINPEGLQEILDGKKPDVDNFRIIKSRSLYSFGQYKSIAEEISMSASDLRI